MKKLKICVDSGGNRAKGIGTESRLFWVYHAYRFEVEIIQVFYTIMK